MRLLVLLFCFSISISLKGQLMINIRTDLGSITPLFKDAQLNAYRALCLEFRKPIRTDFIFITGLKTKAFDFKLKGLNDPSSDFQIYSLVVNGKKSYSSEYTFRYYSIPIGIEVKLNRMFRIHYLYENNFLRPSNSRNDYSELFEFGKNSLNSYVPSNTFGLCFHSKGYNIGLSCAFTGKIINENKTHSYEYMNTLKGTINSAYALNFYCSAILFNFNKSKALR